ncbi:hypothetical protein BG005_004316 [Podila minutissima]|nr:hypothetical protein BG005_004316 [Podila minutissima]
MKTTLLFALFFFVHRRFRTVGRAKQPVRAHMVQRLLQQLLPSIDHQLCQKRPDDPQLRRHLQRHGRLPIDRGPLVQLCPWRRRTAPIYRDKHLPDDLGL